MLCRDDVESDVVVVVLIAVVDDDDVDVGDICIGDELAAVNRFE